MYMAGASRLVLITVCDLYFFFSFKEMARKTKQLACGFILLIG